MLTLLTSNRSQFRARNCLRLFGCVFGLMREMLIVKDRIEYQGVSADSLAAIDRVVSEEQDISLPQMRIHHHGVLGNRTRFIE